jgi:hypothetical protein
LATRNFTQIVNLSPGVLTGVNNAGELGAGSGGLAQIDTGNDGIFVHGSRSYDNSYEFDGFLSPTFKPAASQVAEFQFPILMRLRSSRSKPAFTTFRLVNVLAPTSVS